MKNDMARTRSRRAEQAPEQTAPESTETPVGLNESVAHPDSLGPELELGVSSDGPFVAPVVAPAQEHAPKRTRKPREVTAGRLVGVAETRIRRLQEQSKGRLAMLEVQIKGESAQLRENIGRVLENYPRAVQVALKALGVIDQGDEFRALDDAATQEKVAEAVVADAVVADAEMPF